MKADRLIEVQKLCDIASEHFWPNAHITEFIAGVRTALPECLAHILELKDEIKCDDILLKGRKELLDELPECPMHGSDCIPYAVTAIKELYQTTSGQQDEIKSLKAALEATDNAMNLLGIKELQHKVQRAIEIFNANPTGPAARLMHKALTLEGGA